MTLESLVWLVLGATLPSLLITWLATYCLRWLAPRWGLVDQPGERKVHHVPTALGGGLAIGLGVLGPFAIGQLLLYYLTSLPESRAGLLPDFVQLHLPGLWARSGGLWVLLGGATLLLVTGLVDDFRGLDWRFRLSLQFVIAASCVLTQGWRLTAFIDWPGIGWLVSVILSVVWIVALINSFNMLDNMDGLSAGVASIAATILAAVLLTAPDPTTERPQLFVAGFLLVLVGALLGFLCHNRPPARIFMGDAGSYFIGFCIAISTLLATYAGYKSTSPHAILAPVCVMAVPLYDMLSVICIRIRGGRSPFSADRNHFSHRLVELGLSKGQAVLTIYLTTATCGLGALLLHQVNLLGAVVIMLIIACILCLIAILETTARRRLNE